MEKSIRDFLNQYGRLTVLAAVLQKTQRAARQASLRLAEAGRVKAKEGGAGGRGVSKG